MRISFETTADYFKFVFAREFREEESGALFQGGVTLTENLGTYIASPFLKLGDVVLQNLNNPLLIIAATMCLIAAVSIGFYPTTTISIIGKVAPFLLKVTPQMIQFGFYVLSQITILGIGLRAVGRMSNPTLVERWNQKKLVPIQLGAITV